MLSKIKLLLSDITASAVDRISLLLLGAVYFIFIGAWMPKDELGIYAFCVATAQVAAQLLTLGNTPIIVRRIAGQAAPVLHIAGSALLQRIILPFVAAVVLCAMELFLPITVKHSELLWFAFATCSLAQLNLVSRQVLIAEQRFWWATVVGQVGIIAKVIIGVGLAISGQGAFGLLVALLLGNIFEGFFAFFAVRRVLKNWILPHLYLPEFWQFLKEGLPLMGAMLFSQALARADWIIMGLVRSDAETGEYAFAYRLFEMSWMPHAILGTLLLPKLSAAINTKQILPAQKLRLTSMQRLMICISIFLPLVMVISWTNVIDALTAGKYGQVNERVILILCLSVPFAAGTGMLWNLALAMRKSTMVMVIASLASASNILMNIYLIPRYGAIGAAFATSIVMILQYFAYLWTMQHYLQINEVLLTLSLCLIIAVGGYYTCNQFVIWWPLKVIATLILSSLLIYMSGAIRKKDIFIALGIP